MFANLCLDLSAADWKRKNSAWRISLENAIRALSRARKSRQGDHFQAAVLDSIQSGQKPEIPDWAVDKHTGRGKRMGRGVDHWLEQGTVLKPPAEPDPYEERAHTHWWL